MELPKRKQNRLKKYDYSKNGYYFVTICTKNHKQILSKIISNVCENVGDSVLNVPQILLYSYGKIVDKYINAIRNLGKVKIDKYVIMPNHIHMIVEINEKTKNGMSRTPSPTNAVVPYVVSTLKRYVNKEIGENIFQRSFHDHIIRNKNDYEKIWQYIDTNPINWYKDCFYDE